MIIHKPCWRFRIFGRCKKHVSCAGLEPDQIRYAIETKCCLCEEPIGFNRRFHFQPEGEGRPEHVACTWDAIDRTPDPLRDAVLGETFTTGKSHEGVRMSDGRCVIRKVET